MKKIAITLLTCFFVQLPGLAIAADDTVVATVNGIKITEGALNTYMAYRQYVTKEPVKNKLAALHEMINRQIMFEEAKKKNLDKKDNLDYMAEQHRYDLYIQSLLQNTDVGKPVDDKEVQKIYDEKIKTQNLHEYKLRHILLKDSENDAKTVIAELDAGKDFVSLAKEKSAGPSAQNGGDLGWLSLAQLSNMPAFAQAVSEMKKGNVSKSPVKTQYGWHVIKLEDTRKIDPPTLDQVKKQISAAIRQQRLQEYVKNLRNKAKIDIKLQN